MQDQLINAISTREFNTMTGRHFKVGENASWISEAGRVSGTITKVVASEIEFKGYKVHASREEPQYQIKSEKTDHIAMHKSSALNRISSRHEVNR